MSSHYKDIEYAVENGIATLALNRPERLNAYTLLMQEEMIEAFDRADEDPEVRVVILTGNGRAFCAGADLDSGESVFERGDGGGFRYPEDADGGGILTRRMFDLTKPIIAAINGSAVGVGVTMTLAADVRLISDKARLGLVFARRGLVPEAASSFFLPRLVGISRAAEWIFTGRLFGAEEALEAGLVRSIHPIGDLIVAATDLAREMADNTSPVAVALARRMLWQMYAEGTPNLAHRMDSEAMFEMVRSADMKEGVAAFLEKRDTDFAMRVPDDLPEIHRRWGVERGAMDPDRKGSGAEQFRRLR